MDRKNRYTVGTHQPRIECTSEFSTRERVGFVKRRSAIRGQGAAAAIHHGIPDAAHQQICCAGGGWREFDACPGSCEWWPTGVPDGARAGGPGAGGVGAGKDGENGEAQILSGKRYHSPPTSELSTGKMNPEAPGWNKRLRTGAAAPSRGAMPYSDQCVREGYEVFRREPDRECDHTCTVLGTSFDFVGEAYDFYNLYSWEKGFGIRYRKIRLNVEWTKCMQDIFCVCEGKAGVENTRLVHM
ncbi:uncharacterized protein LOC119289975 [Triticum dicoccoides]|uniref:uncharacterized protein LOC119289975 n=1 Tax=Triticum dicoccoides TaxID=85692 RepID=UPI000E7BC901|nr:uncharacterized protein LOC119289975 [Triticum dicoccoides]XP_037425031.1 uncharacterized protein LOC119289975 [Triticum dicoccoides]XP_037425034.1 uncharacterized protein LOC119289975 [Triticum dicoccoides]XP_037425040.1 uncharacterized protein LOC119289975 [Triticum dicoccoides]XP_037425043.1 uncharacterized protein LOC119289975 [Triticum dicoccoides]XP_037425049.1 uncharacterized protein LOC119289975 [Triticum dicoccoides]XP_037425052.1 uncharacterized protein LOC119289975 [Triticum dic